MKKPTFSFILPTYNEAGNIVHLISTLKTSIQPYRFSFEIMVIDDQSSDGTVLRIRKSFGYKKWLKIIVRTSERGLAAAVKRGIEKSIGDYIIVMDTDFNHDPTEIPKFVALAPFFDIVIGSRFVGSGGMENKLRHRLSSIFNLYVQFILGHHVRDCLSGFFLISRKKLAPLMKKPIFSGFGEYFIRLIFYAHAKNYSIAELPVFYQNRKYGVSKSKFFKMFIDYSFCALKLRFGL